MLFEKITPEQAGVPSGCVERFIRFLEKNGAVMHSLLLMKGERIFGDFSCKPFSSEENHRMYSQTKSFTAIAILLLVQDGRLSLDDPITKFFPEYLTPDTDPNLYKLTVRRMLTMETGWRTSSWFRTREKNRVSFYFSGESQPYPSGLVFQYDSTGSQVLCSLAERLSGMKMLDYLRMKLFDKMGTFKNAEMLQIANGDSWGDSALLCSVRDVASIGRLLMNGGEWNGEQLIDPHLVREAVSRQVDNDETGFDNDADSAGYGYQIWRLKNGFWFRGMGGQFTVCIPEKDLICVCTGDNQGLKAFSSLFVAGFNEFICERAGDPLPEDNASFASLSALGDSLELAVCAGKKFSPCRDELDSKIWLCPENPMGISRFSVKFSPDGTKGEFLWENAQGEKKLPFGVGFNVFTKFPQFGYSDLVGGQVTEDGFTYKCAVSGAWREDRKFALRIQIIDRYFGNLFVLISFDPDGAALVMNKTAEHFLDEYQGRTYGVPEN
ncbi:MAG: serine hydrolase [Clostridia bacterium]|nr:serine hydrolase [Clostridia bacterium]